ncbi:MAG: hypothetical protein A2Z75_01315 [Chloroflexi bacterium RBG_13_50_10]|nr:MAG: hypothetical protein A2Z75_01315 [Chloroflexi bacterium RBG_13_50_10]
MKSRRLFYRVGLAVFLVACLLIEVVYFYNAHEGEASKSVPDYASMSAVERQAWQTAEGAVGSNRKIQQQFVNELLGLYYEVKDSDLAIFCISGGWGKKPLSADVQGRSWLAGIEAELGKLGYSYCEVDDIRTGSGLLSYLFEFKEQLMNYPSKARELAAKVDFLTRQVTGLKVILTGQSNGAAFAGEVISRLKENPEVYSIQIGIPFWHRVSKASRSLVIDNNGVGTDALTQKDIVRLIKANLVDLFILNHAPSFTPVDWVITRAVLVFGPYKLGLGLRAPGHDYMWEYPGVGPVIQDFLVKNFSVR